MKQLFSYTVFHTKDYAVGPLDYCSIGHIVNGQYVQVLSHLVVVITICWLELWSAGMTQGPAHMMSNA